MSGKPALSLDYLLRQRAVEGDWIESRAGWLFNCPFPGIEEELDNAAYHRSYEQREPVEVRVNPDGIEIISYPGPDASIRIEALSDRIGACRDHRIGEFLKELELTEGGCTGIPKVRAAMEHSKRTAAACQAIKKGQSMLPLHQDPYFTFRFAADRIIPRFHLEGVEFGQPVEVYKIDSGTDERLGLLATATVGEGGWVDLPEPIIVQAGEAFIAVPGDAEERMS